MSPDGLSDIISLFYLYPQNVFHLNFSASSKSLNMDNRYYFKFCLSQRVLLWRLSEAMAVILPHLWKSKHTVKDLAHVYINELANKSGFAYLEYVPCMPKKGLIKRQGGNLFSIPQIIQHVSKYF